MTRIVTVGAAQLGPIARCGTRGLRVQAVAKSAGVSTALIYHHFGDRSGAVVFVHELKQRIKAEHRRHPLGPQIRSRRM